jgi:hypothetical protein
MKMGWTFTHKENGVSTLDFFKQEFDQENGKVLDCKVKDNVAYLLYQFKGKNTALVCLLERRKDYHNFGYKDMCEDCGPYYHFCPASILDKLSPTDNQSALEWRAECRKRSTLKKIKLGDKIEFVNEFSFGAYGKAKTFTSTNVAKHHFFAHEIGIEVKLRKSSIDNNQYKFI